MPPLPPFLPLPPLPPLLPFLPLLDLPLFDLPLSLPELPLARGAADREFDLLLDRALSRDGRLLSSSLFREPLSRDRLSPFYDEHRELAFYALLGLLTPLSLAMLGNPLLVMPLSVSDTQPANSMVGHFTFPQHLPTAGSLSVLLPVLGP